MNGRSSRTRPTSMFRKPRLSPTRGLLPSASPDSPNPIWGQYRHDQSRLSTGHGIGVLIKMNTVTKNYWLIYAAATVTLS